jgi:sugar lactone lactonase YvrE
MSAVFDHRRCELGEGPIWHPIREQLFWFDIKGRRLLTVSADGPEEWAFPEMVSAAGVISRDELLIASETALLRFNLVTGARETVTPLEAGDPSTRSNDGRADPQGGFWIGTMGTVEGAGTGPKGSIWRFHKGELRRLFAPIAISNAICFAPDGRTAHFADTVTGRVMRVALDADGWPVGQPSVYLDLTAEGLNPDGAVVDRDGLLWLAEWGSSRVSAYAPDGARVRSVGFNAPHTSCPAFGGDGGTTLFCTSALHLMDDAARAAHPNAGKTFMAPGIARGQSEHLVIL